jgi:hypothetical protein
MLKPFSAVLVGTVVGFSLGAPVNALFNETMIQSCMSKTHTHQIVSFRGFFGTTVGCVDRRYL